MKRFVLIVAIISIAIMASVSHADTTSTQPMSQEDAAKLRQDIAALATALGVQPEGKQAQAQPQQQLATTQQQSKSVADVADRALTMVGSLVGEISKKLQDVAPQVWRIMIRQQYANAFGDLLLPWGLFLLVFPYKFLSRKMLEKTNYETHEGEVAVHIFTKIIPIPLGAIFGIWGIVQLSSSIKILINPEFYAIRDLLTMLLGASHGTGM